jgi:cytochrome bd-type quinol oxidase subunit 1
MPITFEFDDNIVHLAGMLMGWCIVLYFMTHRYKKQNRKPVIWKMIVVVWVGLMAFSLNIPMFGQIAKLAILPLGVWILYLILRNRSWETYRRFAWLGFAANYIFLVMTVLSGAIHQAVYDKNDPTTYFADVRKAEVIGIHPSARAAAFDDGRFLGVLGQLQAGDMTDSLDW